MIIINGIIVTWSRPNLFLQDHALRIEDSTISEIGLQSAILEKYPNEETIDAAGQLVMPGLICAHTHFYGAYSRGMGIPGQSPSAFPEILEKLWWPLDLALDEESVRYSAWVSVLDAIRHGTTTLFDHHASPNCIGNSLDGISEVIEESGVRASLCYEVTDRNGKAGAFEGINENVRFIKRINSGKNINGRLAASFGLHASLTLSNETLEKARISIPEHAGFHVHAAEHPIDQYDSLQKSGLRVIDRLHSFGILDERTIVAHAVHVDAKEIQLLADTQTWVSHQPRSNMNNAVGIGNVESMMRMGVRMCLGNDGFSNAMLDEWKTAYLVHKLVNHDPRFMNGNTVVEMGVYQNSELATQQFGLPIGKLEEGYQADMIFIDYKPFTPLSVDNLPWHMLFGFQNSMISTTIVAGKVLMKNHEMIELDEKRIFSKAMEQAVPLWNRYNNSF